MAPVVENDKHTKAQVRVCGIFSRLGKHYPRSSKKMALSGGPIPRLFWSHPYQPPKLRWSTSPVPSPPIRVARLRILGSAWPASSLSRLGVLGSTVGSWIAEYCRCRVSSEGLNPTTSMEYVALLPTRKRYCPVPDLECYMTNSALHVSSGVGQESKGACC